MNFEEVNKLIKKVFMYIIIIILSIIVLTNVEIRNLIFKAIKPILVAFSIAYLVDPSVRFFSNKLKISRTKSIILTLLILIGFFLCMITLILPNLLSSFNELNSILSARNLENIFSLSFVEDTFGVKLSGEMIVQVQEYLGSLMGQISSKLTEVLSTLVSSVLVFTSSMISFFLAFIISIYMLFSKNDLCRRIKRMFKAYLSKARYDYLSHVAKKADDVFSGFFVGKIIDSAILGVLCFLVMVLFKIPNATTFGFIVGITNMIPYFGPVIGAVPCVLATLILVPSKAIWVLIIIIALQQFDGLILGPKILGDKLGVDAFWIITAVTLGGAIWGIMGMLVGVPVVILIKNLIEESVSRRLEG